MQYEIVVKHFIAILFGFFFAFKIFAAELIVYLIYQFFEIFFPLNPGQIKLFSSIHLNIYSILLLMISEKSLMIEYPSSTGLPGKKKSIAFNRCSSIPVATGNIFKSKIIS